MRGESRRSGGGQGARRGSVPRPATRMNLPSAMVRTTHVLAGQRLPARATVRQSRVEADSIPRRCGLAPASASKRPRHAPGTGSAFNRGNSCRFPRCLPRQALPGAAALWRASGQADQDGIVRPAVGRSYRSARQACVCFSDDFAGLEVECPSFCNQLAHTCEPASGFGGTVGDIRRLHDEAPYRWRVRDNPNHSETPPLCEMRFRYMRITDNLCCCFAT